MHVFITGGSGFIGSAIIPNLIKHGHTVSALSRSSQSSTLLKSHKATPVEGGIEDLQVLAQAAKEADGVIHAGFIHDFSNYEECCRKDKAAIVALGTAMIGSNKPFIVTSGALLVPHSGRPALETDEATPLIPRSHSDAAALAFSSQKVNVRIIRLPPSVHDKGDHGFVPMLMKQAQTNGKSGFIGEGSNRWPAVHRQDAAEFYRLALESRLEGGINLHPIAEEGIPFKTITQAIGKKLDLPVESIQEEEMGWMGRFAAMDGPTDSTYSRKVLGWEPKGLGLLEDIELNY
jgi:nucleoside-diphosphate-sugar epimerase